MSLDDWRGPEKTTPDTGRDDYTLVSQARLRVVEGAEAGREIELGEARVTVGRAGGNDLHLDDPLVSAIHLELRGTDAGYRLRDLDSTNGTFLGSIRVHDVVLTGNARIRLGNTVADLTLLDRMVPVRLSADGRFGHLVGGSTAMRRLFALLERVAPSDLTVLLEGETGTGKEEVARAIHQGSLRANGPFVVLDCGTIPEGLAAALLFGHERGAFTGADQRRMGAFECANDGTIFLDEVGELNPALQPKLLRVLETREVVRLGDHRPRPANVRVVAATHRDLRRMVNDGRFRPDFYYRLAEVQVGIPTLRERIGDVALLAEHFLLRAALRTGRRCCKLSPEALARLSRHRWPGNVRELRNLMERLTALAESDEIDEEEIDLEIKQGSARHALPVHPELPYKESRAQVIKEFDAVYLSELHERTDGNLSEASRQAHIARHYLRHLFRKAKISYRD